MKEDIAIVGLSFKLPQDVHDVASFWDVLENRKNLMTDWPESRMSQGSVESTGFNKLQCRGGHFITEDPGVFDAPFFSVTAREAASMDPMQRWTLETSYRAFENAGIPVENLRGSKTAVFSASMTDDYKRMVAQDPDNAPRMAVTGTFASIEANRISWYFDLHGPSVHVDSACSSSLLAVDLACQAIQNGNASAALVTGSNLILGPTMFQMLGALNFLSPDSRCYSFDHRANGYARGEGVIALIIKPLSAALRDGNMIRAVIRSSGSNQDGHTPGLTQPSPEAQEELIREVYEKASLPFDLTRYFEAHGTGTPVGDPIEMKAIGRVFRSSRSAEEPLYVGSVKANIGHLEGSSGLAGILKSILVLEKGTIPPNALFEKINPKIDADFYHLEVPTICKPWPKQGLRRVSVNSFGFGGTNTHVILDDALHYLQERGLSGVHCTEHSPTQLSPISNGINHSNGLAQNGSNGNQLNGHSMNGHAHESPSKLLVWTAGDEKALGRMVQNYEAYSKEHISDDENKLDELAYTLAARRSFMLWRTFAIAKCGSDNQELNLSPAKPIRSSSEAGLAFVFTGQGAQYVKMGLGLLQYPIYKNTLQEIDSIYHVLGCEWSIFDELLRQENIDSPEYSQPLSTAVQIGLIELLRSFNIVPKAVVGHSSGEIAAAYAIGALSLQSTCKVSFFRGQLAGKLKASSTLPGAMMSVNLPEHEVEGYLHGIAAANVGENINVACINSPLNCTLSGDETVIDAVKEKLDQDGIFAQKLKTGVAYHSTSMSAIADEYLSKMGTLDPGSSKPSATIPMVSSVTGRSVRSAELMTAEYWVANMVSPVRFADAVQLLTQRSSTLKVGLGHITDLIEVGPHPALRRPVQDTLSQLGNKRQDIRYASVLHRSHPAVQTILELVGQLFSYGHAVSIMAANEQSVSNGPRAFLIDCPEYPFDHSKSYWVESRLSRDFRLRESVSGETLGTKFYDWNPLEPRWRNFLSVESTPWIGDHVISDTTIYPAAGMLVMAMEAVKQICPANTSISGYLFKEAHFISPIVVKETWEDRTETILRLQPIQRPYEKESTSYEITIFSLFDNRWTECFRATVQVQYEESTQAYVIYERQQAEKDILGRYIHAAESCTRPISSQVFYEDATEHGLKYGEWFQLLEDIRWDGKENAVARVDVSKGKHQTTSLVHPALLDTIFHVLRVSTTQGLSLSSNTNVPVRLINAWFSSSGWQHTDTSFIRFLASSSAVKIGQESEEGVIYALADNGTILCSVDKAMTAAVSRGVDGDAVDKRLLYSIEWKPQLSLLGSDQLASVCDADNFVKDEDTMLVHHQKLSLVLDKVAAKTLKFLSGPESPKVPNSQRRHLEWLNEHVKGLPQSRIENEVDDDELETLLQEVEALHPPWKLHTTVVRRLTSILTGETDPLEVIFDSDLAEVFYADMFENVCDHRLLKFLELASHENPSLRILEVGAGTGGMTSRVLAALQDLETQSGALKFSEYTYTDVSPAFFEKASKRWEGLKERMTFKTFDMKYGPKKQGFEPGSYDLIVAGSVLHATEDLMATMRNVRKTLKPGGHLLLLEVIAPQDVVTNFTFGLVPGWWGRREEWRGLSPAIPEKQWDQVLRTTGYTGNDLCLRDYKSEECHIFSIIVSRATEDSSLGETSVPRITVITDEQVGGQTNLANLIMNKLVPEAVGESRIIGLNQIKSTTFTDEEFVICIAESNRPLLTHLSEERFVILQDFIKRTQRLLWITVAGMDDPEYPQYSMMQGFLRSIRHEVPDKHIVTLAIEPQTNDTAATYAKYVTEAFTTSFVSSASELEYIVRDGIFSIGRAVEDVSGNSTLQSLLRPRLEDKAIKEGPPLKLSVSELKTLDSLQLLEDASYDRELLPHEVEIQAKTWGVNFRDILCALGRLNDGELGVDCAGVVTRVGKDCDRTIQVGDRVCMISIDCMRTHPRALDKAVLKIPDGLSFDAAAAILVPGMTANYSLLEVARLRRGQKILIHSAAGSTGQMAIWMAKMKGAEIFATVGSDEKRQFLMDTFSIPADHIFSSRDTSFAQGLKRVTNGYGVDVVLNSLSGEGLRASWDCVAPFGKFVEIGVVDIRSNSSLPMGSFARNVSFSAVDLRHIIQTDPDLTSMLLKNTIDLLVQGAIQHPGPLHVYPVSEVEKAFRYLQGGRNIGRILIHVDPSDVVPVISANTPLVKTAQLIDMMQQLVLDRRSWRFDENATYVIAGGSGGLGRAIMKWMVGRGAKNFIVPSRSGASSMAAFKLIAELTQLGVNIVAPKCDVSSAESLAGVLNEYAHTMPPIKGCINAAMVLQDAVFENMTHAQWDLTIKSKVQSSLNLHQLLPEGLDFFILLSSLNGVCGALAQSNYAAGCSFQDGLARYRVSQGQKAVSFDIGWMHNIGIVAETESYQRQRKAWNDMQKISDTELLALLSIYCDPSQPLSSGDASQVLVGLRTPADFLIHGQEPPSLFKRPLFAAFSHVVGESQDGSTSDAHVDQAAAFRQATDTTERIQIVIRALALKLARAMSISPDDIELNKPLSSYGVDSLMAVELRNWIGRDFSANVAVFDIMGNVPVSAIGDLVVARSSVGKT